MVQWSKNRIKALNRIENQLKIEQAELYRNNCGEVIIDKLIEARLAVNEVIKYAQKIKEGKHGSDIR